MIMPKRKWKPINGYEGLYEISNLGEIKSYRKSKPKILKNIKDRNGYLVITLCKDNNKERISKSSIGRKRSKRLIDEQIKRQQKKVYCIELHKEFNSIKEASEFLGISDTSLSKHLKCIYKTCGGYHWKYL